jgi:hypothetical protein
MLLGCLDDAALDARSRARLKRSHLDLQLRFVDRTDSASHRADGRRNVGNCKRKR